MTQSYPLDAVIRKVGRDVKAASSAERVVIIDVGKRQAVDKKRILSEARYFLVSNTSDGRKGAECKVPLIHLRDFGNDREIAIQVSYSACCDPGNERKVAEGLFDGPHPAAVLNEKIKRWVVDFIGRRQAEFIDNYFDKKTELQTYIRTRAYEEIGLNLTAKLSLKEGEELAPIDIGPLQFSVRVKDYDHPQSLTIKGELQVDEQSKINAVLYRPSKAALDQLVEKEVRNYFADNVTLHKFCTELNKDGVKHGLIAHLNGILKPKGRRIGYLSLEGSAQDSQVKPFFETNQNVECKIQEYPEPVIIKNTVQMILQDIAKYRSNGSPDLKGWIEEKLVRVIHDLLFDAKYIDLLLKFQSRKERVKDILSAEAEAIGYNIKQLITVPDLEPFEWLKPFDIEVEENFETKLPKFKVKLGIVVTVRIKDLQGIEYHLNHRQSVPKLMKKAILDDTRRLLHTLDPERFYMRFFFTDEPGETAVEEELIRRISKTLTKQFNAEVLTVIPKVGDTDMTERLRALQSTVCPFEFEFFSPDSPALVPVRFVGSFKVESVDAEGWHKFQLLKYDINDIKDYLEATIPAELDKCRRAIESGRLDFSFDDVEEAIKHLAENCIKEVYGLSITVNAVRRTHTLIEIGERQVGLDAILKSQAAQIAGHSKALEAGNEKIDSLSDQVKAAEQVLLNIIVEGGSNTEIEAQKKIIASLRDELQTAHTPAPKALKKSLSANSSGRVGLPDFSAPKRQALGEKPNDKNGKRLTE